MEKNVGIDDQSRIEILNSPAAAWAAYIHSDDCFDSVLDQSNRPSLQAALLVDRSLHLCCHCSPSAPYSRSKNAILISPRVSESSGHLKPQDRLLVNSKKTIES